MLVNCAVSCGSCGKLGADRCERAANQTAALAPGDMNANMERILADPDIVEWFRQVLDSGGGGFPSSNIGQS